MFATECMRKCRSLGWAVLLLVVFSTSGYADFFDDFESRATGPYIPQQTMWQDYAGTPGIFERPMVTSDAQVLFGTKCLSNQDDPSGSQEEGTVLMESNPQAGLPFYGQDVIIRFMFMRTVEQGSSPNKIRLDVYDTSGERFAIAMYSNRVYNDNKDENIIENLAVGTWYWFDLLLAWDAESDSYGNMAFLRIWNDDKIHLLGQAYPTTNGSDLLNISKLWVMMRAGSNGSTLLPRPTCYIDDLQLIPITAPSGPAEPVCGDAQHPYPTGDLTLDCHVDLADMAVIAQHWLECTDPAAPCSYIP